MAWIYLVAAGLLEIGWAIGLKYTEGFTRVAPSILTGIALIGSMAFMGLAVRHLPLPLASRDYVCYLGRHRCGGDGRAGHIPF
jgi:quaternary ammonium compound-resistance protein SugE